MIHLVLPVPPSANRYYRRAGTHTHISGEARAYLETVRRILKAKKVQAIQGEVCLDFRWYRARKSGDLSNRAKICEDALKDVAFGDDARVAKLTMERFEDKAKPRMEVTITPYQEAA